MKSSFAGFSYVHNQSLVGGGGLHSLESMKVLMHVIRNMNSVERGKNKMPLPLLQKCPLLIIWCIYFQIFSLAYKNITLCACKMC